MTRQNTRVCETVSTDGTLRQISQFLVSWWLTSHIAVYRAACRPTRSLAIRAGYGMSTSWRWEFRRKRKRNWSRRCKQQRTKCMKSIKLTNQKLMKLLTSVVNVRAARASPQSSVRAQISLRPSPLHVHAYQRHALSFYALLPLDSASILWSPLLNKACI